MEAVGPTDPSLTADDLATQEEDFFLNLPSGRSTIWRSLAGRYTPQPSISTAGWVSPDQRSARTAPAPP